MFIFSTIAMTLPFAFRCRESGCFIDKGEFATSHHNLCACTHALAPLPVSEGNVECSNDNTSLFLHTVVESTTETFICRSVCFPSRARAHHVLNDPFRPAGHPRRVQGAGALCRRAWGRAVRAQVQRTRHPDACFRCVAVSVGSLRSC